MYPDWIVIVLLAVTTVFIWLVVLSFSIWRQNSFLKSLFPSSGERDIRKKFEEIIKIIEEFKSEMRTVKEKGQEIRDQGLEHLQKVELMRFNPYDDTGGDQSFAVALLDSFGSGVVITSLHARSGTRVFAKSVREGKGDKHELSKEEELVIKKAMEKKL